MHCLSVSEQFQMRYFLARHGETVYNAAARIQGNSVHTPLSRTGIAQAEAMGAALADFLADPREIDIWASTAGRALQTVAIIVEHLHRDFLDVSTDPRLVELEVGAWEGRLYADVIAADGVILCTDRRLFTVQPPGGEDYPTVAARLRDWLVTLSPDRDVLVVSHGMTLRVLRGLLAGGEPFNGVPIAEDAPQGTMFLVENGIETRLHLMT
ncbi:histidine phosphatase family protein [soil metagenome]